MIEILIDVKKTYFLLIQELSWYSTVWNDSTVPCWNRTQVLGLASLALSDPSHFSTHQATVIIPVGRNARWQHNYCETSVSIFNRGRPLRSRVRLDLSCRGDDSLVGWGYLPTAWEWMCSNSFGLACERATIELATLRELDAARWARFFFTPLMKYVARNWVFHSFSSLSLLRSWIYLQTCWGSTIMNNCYLKSGGVCCFCWITVFTKPFQFVFHYWKSDGFY